MLININRCTPPREHNILLGLFVLQITFFPSAHSYSDAYVTSRIAVCFLIACIPLQMFSTDELLYTAAADPLTLEYSIMFSPHQKQTKAMLSIDCFILCNQNLLFGLQRKVNYFFHEVTTADKLFFCMLWQGHTFVLGL